MQSRAVRQATALGLPALALLLIWTSIISPLHQEFQNADQDIEARRFLLGKYASVLTRVGYSEEQARDVVSRLDKSELLEAAPEAVIAAILQSRIADLARQGSLQTHTMQVLPTRAEGGLKWVGLGITFSGAPENIANVFAEIEGAKPYLFIERFTLNAQGPPSSGSESPPVVMADFEIYGAALEEQSP